MNTTELTNAAAAFAAEMHDKGSIAYAAARGRFYAAILEASDAKVTAPPARYAPRPLSDFMGRTHF